MTESSVVAKLALDGHDSELFSFFSEESRRELQQHPNARIPLWTFAGLRQEVEPATEIIQDVLVSVPVWNTIPSCFAWTAKPHLTPCEGSDTFRSYCGFVTDDRLSQVESLILIRHLFVQGNTCSLNDHCWIAQAADPELHRLAYIRGWDGCSTNSPGWERLRSEYFSWTLAALENLKAQNLEPAQQ